MISKKHKNKNVYWFIHAFVIYDPSKVKEKKRKKKGKKRTKEKKKKRGKILLSRWKLTFSGDDNGVGRNEKKEEKKIEKYGLVMLLAESTRGVLRICCGKWSSEAYVCETKHKDIDTREKRDTQTHTHTHTHTHTSFGDIPSSKAITSIRSTSTSLCFSPSSLSTFSLSPSLSPSLPLSLSLSLSLDP